MQVYCWQAVGAELIRHTKRPNSPWTAAELEKIPRDVAITRRIVDGLALPPRGTPRSIFVRVGVCTHLSPSIGVYRQGMAELGRHDVGNRVYITWLRGFWEKLHIVHQHNEHRPATRVAQQLVERVREVVKEKTPNKVVDARLAGRGVPRRGPYYVYVALRTAGRATGFDLESRDATRESA